MSETEPDAVALFRPTSLEKLKPFLDLDDENEESDGLYAESLDDGSVLVHTFQPYAAFQQSPLGAREWLLQFGEALPEVHDDVRGLLFFPETCEPEGRTYDAVVSEVEDDGIWIPTTPVEGLEDDILAAMDFPAGALPPGVDLAQLEQVAAQLLGGGAKGAASSFEIGRLFEGMQQQLMDVFGGQPMVSQPDGDDDPAHDEGRDDGDLDEGTDSAPVHSKTTVK
jgi:hypothetical protein